MFKKFLCLFLIFLVLWIYRGWFQPGSFSAGDWNYLFSENIREFSWWPKPPFLWLEPYYRITAKLGVEVFGFSWELTERLFWFWPFLLLSFFSSWYFTRQVFDKNNFSLFTFHFLLFTTNTYILMIVGGGQMGVAMAYALAPLVLGSFINKGKIPASLAGKQNAKCKKMIFSGLVLAIQMMFDPRIAYITLIAVGVYLGLSFLKRDSLNSLFLIRDSLFAILIALSLNCYWLLPFIWSKEAISPFDYQSLEGVKFLSWARFSETLSLLHPNWPENIFGKTYLMRPEFLVLPLLAFSSLPFIQEKTKEKRIQTDVLFFAFLALMGAFLAKGAKPPGGGVYLWLFQYFPGMKMFRDPTKFYLLTSLAYSFLIPISFCFWTKWLQKKRLEKWENFLAIGLVVYWLFLLRPAWQGQLGGTFQPRPVPEEYIELKNYLQQQPQFFRTFWLPKRQRFGFASLNHPALEGSYLPSEEELRQKKVKYVIIPYDSKKEIFLEDRRYSKKKRKEYEKSLNQVEFLKKIKNEGFGKLTIYEYKNFFPAKNDSEV